MSIQESQNGNQEQITSELTPEETQQMNPQDQVPIDSEPALHETVRNLERMIAEQQMTIRKQEAYLNRILEEQERNRPAPPPRNPEEDAKKFFTDPIGVLQEREERLVSHFKQALEPLYKVAQGLNAETELDRLINETRRVDPYVHAALSDAEVESAVRELMKNPNTPMTPEALRTLAMSVVGAKSLGLLGNKPTPTPNNLPRNGNVVTPPHIRPQGVRNDPPITPKRELTEQDRMAMRIGGIKSEEEYWALMDAAPDKVVTKR